MRFGLRPMILDFFAEPWRSVGVFLANRRCIRFGFGRLAGAGRVPFFFPVECLAKIKRLSMDWDVR